MSDIPLLGAPSVIAVPPAEDTIITVSDDGEVTVTYSGAINPSTRKETGFFDNLAEVWEPTTVAALGQELYQGISNDDNNRGPWLAFFKQAQRLLGCSIEDATMSGQGAQANSRVANLKSSTMLQACINFQSNATAELFPANGPAKAKTNAMSKEADDLSPVLAKAMNEYFTVGDPGYQSDFDRSMFHLGFAGMVFRKVYRCPQRRRPVSEMISGARMIISDATRSLRDCERFTNEIPTSQNTLKALQNSSFYRNIAIGTPSPDTVSADAQAQRDAGNAQSQVRPEDLKHTIWECYCLMTPFGDSEVSDSLASPYIVTIDKDSQIVLRIVRNWDPDDPLRQPLQHIVEYPMFPGLGYWAYGFSVMLQSSSRAATGLMNIMVDSGIFANFPGGLRAKGVKTAHNSFRPMPGEFPEIDLAGTDDIRKAVMPLPYKSPDPFLLQLLQHIEKWMQTLSGIAEIPVGSSMQNTPVGTIMAAVDQAIKPISAVHKRCYAALAQEFAIFKRLFKEDPSPLLPPDADEKTKAEIVAALNTASVVPVADPNIPSLAYRLMQVQALITLVQMDPAQYDTRKIHVMALKAIGFDDYESVMKPEDAPPPADMAAQAKMAEIKLKEDLNNLKKLELKMRHLETIADNKIKEEALRAGLAEQIRQAEDSKMDRESRERIAASRERIERIQYLIDLAKDLGMFGMGGAPELNPLQPTSLATIS